MTKFLITYDQRRIEFAVNTTDEVTSFRGTPFVPNRCAASVSNGAIVSVTLERVDENGWGIDDPAGPDGAELNVSYGGGEIMVADRGKLPMVAQNAVAAIEKATR